ncbi:hypothetical protein NQ315_002914 [Exocentrus adspersus]|uniref:Reverse transcriptase domain-containing protein n=1 Tax=Exocentrus adspersus TaxID=1586481 RepID=A0AAV8V643_9CUCU|nr:hypothetical protein NQ315_002914 [Exocentrus adspersus]
MYEKHAWTPRRGGLYPEPTPTGKSGRCSFLATMQDVSLSKLIKSYLQDRKARVKVEGEKSTYRDSEAGVPQGTVLSPHLFKV